MSTTQSGTLSLAGSVKDIYSGTGLSSGPTVNWSNTVSLPDANVDGIFVGSFTLTTAGTSSISIDPSSATPLSAITGGTGSVQQSEFPFSGFTSPGATARVIGVYIEMLTNSTWVSGASSHVEIGFGSNVGGASSIAVLGVPGDCAYLVGQTSKTAIVGSSYLYTMAASAATSTTTTFKIIFVYRNGAVAT